jgi:tight adherence protein C
MTPAIAAGTAFALGIIGVIAGVRRRPLSLEAVLSRLTGSADASVSAVVSPQRDGTAANERGRRHQENRWRVDHHLGRYVSEVIGRRGSGGGALSAKLALAGTTLDMLCGQCALSGVVGFALPGVMWALMTAGGVHLPVAVPIWAGVLTGLVGVGFPVFVFESQVKGERRRATRIICSFLDLVVLGLAAGMGIESALVTAAQVGDTDISARILQALAASRDTGEPPWDALYRLGESLGLEDLCELASTAGMAGTEGARVRATLTARAASIRRHELATVESEANAVTDKLFIPGAFLLLGFLLFIGYPAFSRIASGF